MNPDYNFWRGRRVLLTGHTGFKGAWLAIYLQRLGAQVTGIALDAETEPNLFAAVTIPNRLDHHICDIRNQDRLAGLVRAAQPEIVFHLAAQALVRRSYRQPLSTFATNVQGTAHLLDALRGLDSVRAAILVTTDKVYRNLEQGRAFCETDELGGHDPYSASKAAAEIVITSYRDSFLSEQGVQLASARAGNVIGGGDWSEDRLLPDAVRAWGTGNILEIRSPEAVRPWQHVLEPLSAYLKLAQTLVEKKSYDGAWNFGPSADANASVRTVIEIARRAYGDGAVNFATTHSGVHEAGLLSLNVDKARAQLGVVGRFTLEQAVTRTMHWYREFDNGQDAYSLCVNDIDAFEAAV